MPDIIPPPPAGAAAGGAAAGAAAGGAAAGVDDLRTPLEGGGAARVGAEAEERLLERGMIVDVEVLQLGEKREQAVATLRESERSERRKATDAALLNQKGLEP